MGILGFAVGGVGGIGDDVVPGVELEDVVGGLVEVAAAELEGVAAFEVFGGIVGKVGRERRRLR